MTIVLGYNPEDYDITIVVEVYGNVNVHVGNVIGTLMMVHCASFSLMSMI